MTRRVIGFEPLVLPARVFALGWGAVAQPRILAARSTGRTSY